LIYYSPAGSKKYFCVSPRAARAIGWLLAAWLGATGWVYYHGHDWTALWQMWRYWPTLIPNFSAARAWIILCDLALLAALLWLTLLGRGAGAALLAYAGLATGEKPGQFALSLAAGWGAMALAMFGLGALGAWNRPLVFALLGAGTAALAFGQYRGWRAAAAAPPKASPAGARPLFSWNKAWLLIFACFAALNLLCAFVPEIFYDALVYHLALPDLYWKHGGLMATPWNLYAGLPQLVECLYALALPVGGDGLARLLHWAFGLGAALLTFAMARRYVSLGAAYLAALLFYSIPLVGVLSGQSMTDLGWVFFQLAGLYALCIRLEAPDNSRNWTLLAGMLCGCAMGSRYQAWLPSLLAGAALARALPAGGKGGRREALLLAAAALAAAAPWLVKNAVFYHNPVYPFLHEYFSAGPAPRWRDLLADGGGRDPGLLLSSWAGLRSWLLYFWDYSFGANDLGPALLLAFPALLLRKHLKQPLLFLREVFLLVWFTQSFFSGLARFLLPCFPLAFILFAAAAENYLDRRVRNALNAGLLFVFCSNFMLQVYIFKAYGADNAVLGLETAAEYLKTAHKTYPRPPYVALEYINNTLPQDARVLFVGEARGFYCRRDYLAGAVFNEPPLREWLRGAAGAEELLARFRAERITHVLINHNELEAWRRAYPAAMALDSRAAAVFDEFTRRFLRLKFESKTAPAGSIISWTQVYEVAL